MLLPTVSVVIPTFNRAGFLAAAVQSIRAQTRPVQEIIIVDDGSTDDTAAVVERLGTGIRCVRQPNAGPAAARNRGIREAGGEFVAFLDTDDRWLPEKLALQVAITEAHPRVALVAGDMAVEDEHGHCSVASNFALRRLDGLFDRLAGGPVPNAPALLLKVNFINTSTVLARRSVLLELQGFDPRLRYGEDLELWLRIATRHGVACVPSVQEIRVEHASNVTRSIEPMLQGYVRMAEVIRGWAREQMPAWGSDPDRYVADSLFELGYWYFAQGRLPEARQALLRSLAESPSARARAYAAASTWPRSLVDLVRRAKGGWPASRAAGRGL